MRFFFVPVQLAQERGIAGKCSDHIGMRWTQRLFPNSSTREENRFAIAARVYKPYISRHVDGPTDLVVALPE
jgi:hypothetical protein